MIALEQFNQIELRIGEVRAAERMAGSDRLLKLTVDLGSDTRTVVGGMAKAYRPDELLGLKVVVVTNLMPTRIRGVMSEGMLLGVGCEQATNISLLTVHRAVANGALVK